MDYYRSELDYILLKINLSIILNTWVFKKYNINYIYHFIMYLDDHKEIKLTDELFNMLNDVIIKNYNDDYIWVSINMDNIELIDFCIDLNIDLCDCYSGYKVYSNGNDFILRRKGVNYLICKHEKYEQKLMYNNINLLIN